MGQDLAQELIHKLLEERFKNHKKFMYFNRYSFAYVDESDYYNLIINGKVFDKYPEESSCNWDYSPTDDILVVNGWDESDSFKQNDCIYLLGEGENKPLKYKFCELIHHECPDGRWVYKGKKLNGEIIYIFNNKIIDINTISEDEKIAICNLFALDVGTLYVDKVLRKSYGNDDDPNKLNSFKFCKRDDGYINRSGEIVCNKGLNKKVRRKEIEEFKDDSFFTEE